jgi:ABC-type uncharacterized transport system substrate-binding protein
LQCGGALALAPSLPAARAADAPRLLHVMSFESPWRWTDGQLAGFRQGLNMPQAQWQVFQMDVKRHRSPAEKASRGRLARELVEQFRPDLIYLSDDDAVAEVAVPYAGSRMPIVFSGVNRTLLEHGIEGAPNITGVLEREHVAESLRLLKAVLPGARRLAVVSDPSVYWDAVIERVRRQLSAVPTLLLQRVERPHDYATFQRVLSALPAQVDAWIGLGVFALPQADGSAVRYPDLARWVVQHTRLPDLSFWIDRVHHGTLLSVTVSEHEQGLAAGRLASAILRDGRLPGSLPVRPTSHGRPAISLARARQLGIGVRSTQLLASEVVRQFAWDVTL